jgi:Ca2+-binding RTX toxin-like protein
MKSRQLSSVRPIRQAALETLESRRLLAADLPSYLDQPNAVGVNLDAAVDYQTAWTFTDIMKRASDWEALGFNETKQQTMDRAGNVRVDDNLWPERFESLTNSAGETINQWRFYTWLLRDLGGAYPGGTYTVQWEGDGGDVGVAAPGVAYRYLGQIGDNGEHRAEFDLPDDFDGNLQLRVDIKTNDAQGRAMYAADPVKNIHVWMPDYEGQSFVGQVWEPGADFSPFHPLYEQRLADMKVLRTMVWSDTLNNTLEFAEDRPDPADAFFTARKSSNFGNEIHYGVPLEYSVEIANRLDKDVWITLPTLAENAYLDWAGSYFAENLEAGRKVFVEWGNEVWIPGSIGFERIQYQFDTRGFGDPKQWEIHTQWMSERVNRFTDAFNAERGDDGDAIRVLSGQAAGDNWVGQNMKQWASPEDFDTVAITGYAGLFPLYTWDETTTTEDIIRDTVEGLPSQTLARVFWSNWATEWDKPLTTYEAGQHLTPIGRTTAPWYDELLGAYQHPDMFGLYQQLGLAYEALDNRLFNHFTYVGGANRNGGWGIFKTQDEPASESPKYQALLRMAAGTLTDDAPMMGATLELERAAYDGYRHQLNDQAGAGDGRYAIVDPNLGTGRIDLPFLSQSGTYNVRFTYYDESDGASQYTVSINGTQLATWTADDNTSGSDRPDGSTRRTIDLGDVVLNNGDRVEIIGVGDGGENAVLDQMIYTPVSTDTGDGGGGDPGDNGGGDPGDTGGTPTSGVTTRIDDRGFAYALGTADANRVTAEVRGDNLVFLDNTTVVGTFPLADVTRGVYIDLGGGDDVAVNLTDLPSTMLGGSGNDELVDANGPALIAGGRGNDLIRDGGNRDFVQGNAGDDTLIAGLGNRDDFSGGAGDDTIDYSDRTVAVAVTLDDQGNDGESGEADNARSDIETVLLPDLGGGVGDNSTTGVTTRIDDRGFAYALGTAANDRVTAEVRGPNLVFLDNQTVVGTYPLTQVTRGVYIDLGGGDDVAVNFTDLPSTLLGGGGNDELVDSAGPGLLAGGKGNDLITDGPNRDFVQGNDGDDTLIAGLGNRDDFSGGRGNDTIDYSTRTGDLSVTLDDQGNDGAPGEADNARSDIENVLLPNGDTGGGGDDPVVTASFADGVLTVTGTEADDVIAVETTGTELTVEANDVEIFRQPMASVVSFTVDALGGRDSISAFHVLTNGTPAIPATINGGAGDDVIVADVAGTVIDGGAGGDDVRVIPIAASSTVYGGEGNDTLRSDGGGDGFLLVEGGAGNDIIQTASRGVRAFGDIGQDVLLATDGVDTQLFGGDDHDYLEITGNAETRGGSVHGEAGDDTLLGSGSDLFGGIGNDELFGNDPGTAATDGFNANLYDGGLGNDTITGDALGHDTLVGGDGDDTLISPGPSDDLRGGDGNDIADYAARTDGPITVTRDNLANDGAPGENDNVRDDIETVLGADDDTADKEVEAVLTDGLLAITGTDADDVIGVDFDGTDLTVTDNGTEIFREVASGVTSIKVDALAGRDAISFYAFPTNGNTSVTTSTILGGAGDDVIAADTVRTVIDGGAGNDEITAVGLAGVSTVFGGDGNDTISASNATDDGFVNIEGNDGDDEIRLARNTGAAFGGAGRDGILAVGLANVLYGGDGDDYLELSGTAEDAGGAAFGEAGNDTLIGSGSDLFGGVGNDELFGGDPGTAASDGFNANLYDGGTGDDTITGDSRGHDSLFGFDGNDRIVTTTGGSNIIQGQAGNDTIVSAAANDDVSGGSGDDTTDYSARAAETIVVTRDGLYNDGAPGENDNVRADVENVLGADTLDGEAANDDGPAPTGITTRIDDRGFVYALGTLDDDSATAEIDGTDVVIFDAGVEVGRYPLADVTRGVYFDLGGGDDRGENRTDLPSTLLGGNGDDVMIDADGPGFLVGGRGNDQLFGGGNRDFIQGNAGNDQLFGEAGRDDLSGGLDDDTLVGGQGSDNMQGGIGIDIVDYSARTDGPITVTLDDLYNDGTSNERDNVRSDIESVLGADSVA